MSDETMTRGDRVAHVSQPLAAVLRDAAHVVERANAQPLREDAAVAARLRALADAVEAVPVEKLRDVAVGQERRAEQHGHRAAKLNTISVHHGGIDRDPRAPAAAYEREAARCLDFAVLLRLLAGEAA